jgi:glycosyltransferase involved in cell wall biosynthesis
MGDQRSAIGEQRSAIRDRRAAAPKRVFPGRVGLQQRVLPAYRAALFETLAEACRGGLSVFAGQAGPEEAILGAHRLERARFIRARNLHIVPAASPLYVLWQAGLVDWLAHWDPDVLVVEANARYLSNRAAIRWMHARGRPVIGWGLGAPPVEARSALGIRLAEAQRRSRQAFLLSCDALIAYSRRGAAEFQALGVPASQIFVAANSVTARPAEWPPGRPAGFDGRPRVLFVGRLQARKRVDDLLRVCAALPEELQPELWIVGDGPARGEFETLARSLYPQARFFGDRRGAELQSLFADADLFVLPGTGGLAVQEAMAAGLPVIVAQGDGTQEDLVRPENGWLVPPDDPARLGETLAQALSDPARLRRMGAESFRIVAEEANLEAMVETFVQACCTVSGVS